MAYDLDDFDSNVFIDVQSIMGDKITDMIDGYIFDAEAYIKNIKDGLEQNNPEQVMQAAHPLKSASASLGVMSVSAIAEALEAGAQKAIEGETGTTSLAELITPIETALERAKSKLISNTG